MKRHTYRAGIIGNGAYLAHVDLDGDVVWLCWPRFDSPSVFGGLIAGPDAGGEFSIRPAADEWESRQSYLDNTNVLATEFTTRDGAFRVIDFAPRFSQYDRHFKPLMLVRKVEPVRGTPTLRVRCRPVGDYGRTQPGIQTGSNHLRFVGIGENTRLTTNLSLDAVLESRPFLLRSPRYLVLTYGPPLEASLEETSERFLQKTIAYWRNWVLQCGVGNFHQDRVIRSALVLKLHQYEDTGAIIASSTTSLPEHFGSGRNWDYRYCWMRDSYYTLRALNNIGHFEELLRYADYIHNIAATKDMGRYRPVYSLSGQAVPGEEILTLDGYRGEQPVRIGNQAYDHVQNDVYGQILVSLLPLYTDARFMDRHTGSSLDLVRSLLDHIDQTLEEPDAGLWEFRNRSQKHCYTCLFHWAGAHAAARIAGRFGDVQMLEKADRIRRRAAAEVETFYDPKLGAYTQAPGSGVMDASLLQLITMNYLDPRSDRARSHLERLEAALRTDNGLFYRYVHEDDFGKPSATFLVCAYWYVEALAKVGRLDDAIAGFERLDPYANHLGLMSETVDDLTGSQQGNFPQTYSHVGLMNAAFRIARGRDLPDFLVSR
jgi:GH15 family glucan-1,4-alpha-glucosidase